MTFFADLYKRRKRDYLRFVVLVPGLVSGLSVGLLLITYLALGTSAPEVLLPRLSLPYAIMTVLAVPVDTYICRRQYRRVREFLEENRIDDVAALLTELVRLPLTSAARLLGVAQVMGIAFGIAGAFLIKKPADLAHVVIGIEVLLFAYVVAAYLAAQAVARPIFDDVRAVAPNEPLPRAAVQAGRLGRKIVVLYTGLGVVPFMIITAFIARKTGEFPAIILVIAAVSTFVSLALTLWVSGSVSTPVRAMVERMDAVAKGDYAVRLDVYSDDDLGLLVNAFNRMLVELESSHAELQRKNVELQTWSESLEQRVEERGRELEEAKRMALHNEKLAALGTLLSGVGHELNNPLSQILRNTSNIERDLRPVVERLIAAQRLLEAGQNGAELAGWLDGTKSMKLDRRLPLMEQALKNIERGTERSLSLVRSLNAFSLSSSEAPKRMALKGLVEEAVNLLSNDARVKSVRFRVDIGPDFEAFVFEAPMLQVILNLAQNAMLAIGGDGEVTFSARAEDGLNVITVADTGPGIPKEILGKIFTPFFTTRPPGQGSGLGLAIVQNIVCEKHSGEIRADNQREGHGAVFEIRIPKNLDAIYARSMAARESARPPRTPARQSVADA